MKGLENPDLALTEGHRRWKNFKAEFGMLKQRLEDSWERERSLMAKCDEVKSELVDSANKLQTAMMVRAEDERTMALMRRETDRAISEAKLSHRKEKDAEQHLKTLKVELRDLKSQVHDLMEARRLDKDAYEGQLEELRLVVSVQNSYSSSQEANGGGGSAARSDAALRLTPYEKWKKDKNIWTPVNSAHGGEGESLLPRMGRNSKASKPGTSPIRT